MNQTVTAFPLSSVIRAGKYYKRGTMARGAFIRATLNALTAVVVRGFKDYEDFKNQLDAVDLGLLQEDLQEVGAADLRKLFEALERKEHACS